MVGIFTIFLLKFITKEFDPLISKGDEGAEGDEDSYKKIEFMKFINRKLEDIFGIKISKFHKESEEYTVQVLFEGIKCIKPI
jgi:hypothetical protein